MLHIGNALRENYILIVKVHAGQKSSYTLMRKTQQHKSINYSSGRSKLDNGFNLLIKLTTGNPFNRHQEYRGSYKWKEKYGHRNN